MQKQNWFKKHRERLWDISLFITSFIFVFTISAIILNTIATELPPPPYPPLPCDSFCCPSGCFLPFNWMALAGLAIVFVGVLMAVYLAFSAAPIPKKTSKRSSS